MKINKILIIVLIGVFLLLNLNMAGHNDMKNTIVKPDSVSTNNFLCYYNLSIKSTTSGNGYYQQLFTFNKATNFTSDLNKNASNFYVVYPNGNYIYAWIQAWNFTSKNITVWAKLQNGTKNVIFEVFSKSENLLSVNGYIGESPVLSPSYAKFDNGKNVFPYYDNYANSSDLTGYYINSNSYVINDGLKIYGNNSISYSPSDITANLTIMGINAQYYTNETNSVSNWIIYTGIANEYTIKITSISQTYVHYGGAPHAFLNSPYKIYNSSYFSNFMIIPKNYTSQFAYYNDSYIGEYSTSPFSSPHVNFGTNDGGYPPNSTFLYVHYFYFATPLPNGMPNYSISNILYPYYILNINSYNQYSNPIKNYYYYNNSVETELNFTFKSYVNNLSILPLNYSNYYWNKGNISISESDFKELNFSTYQYNLSIYYNFLNSNFINPYSLSSYLYPISVVLTFIIGGLIMIGYIKYGKNGDKH